MKAENNTGAAREIDRPDALLKERVEAALKRDHNRKLDGVTVVDVNHGVIHMEGTGVTMTGRLRAIELAWDAAEDAARNDDSHPLRGPDGQAGTQKEKNHDMATQTLDGSRDGRRAQRGFPGGVR